MNKKELIKKYKSYEGKWGAPGAELARQIFIEDLKLLDEPEFEHKKVKIPQFVANWIANVKRNGFKFRNSSRFYEEIVSSDDAYRVMFYILKESIAGEAIRIWVNANRDTFARAWLDGYEVEEEKRYRVSMPKARNYKNHAQILCEEKGKIFWCGEWYRFKTKFTCKELEEAGFGEVFNSPLFEVEEV